MTKTDENRLSSRQVKALPYFSVISSVEGACKKANISKETFYKWIKNPLFKTELERLRNSIVDDAISQLKTNTTKATETLVCLLERDDCPAIQRAAANDILNHVLKFMELKEIEDRLKTLEAARELKG